MNPIDFEFGPEVVDVRGVIHDTMNVNVLQHDFMEVELDSGVVIAVWGEIDPPGYSIEVFNELPENHIATAMVDDQRSLCLMIAWLIEENKDRNSSVAVTESDAGSDPEIDISLVSHSWYADEVDLVDLNDPACQPA